MVRRETSPQGLDAHIVESFSGAHRFLSNFYGSPLLWDGRVAPTAEHHYAAAKAATVAERNRIYEQETPGRAKREGQRITPKEGWDDHLKGQCMASIIGAKFAPGTELATKLLTTGNALLLESNRWHDTYWGHCTCEKHYHWPGSNTLGRLLMAQRSTLRSQPTQPLTRVAFAPARGLMLPHAEQQWTTRALNDLLGTLVTDYGTQVAISGFTPGLETTWGETALAHHVKLWGYVASLNDPTAPPNPDLAAAATRTVLHGDTYDPRWERARGLTMGRDADALVIIQKEGIMLRSTESLVRKAGALGTKIISIDPTSRTVSVDGKGAVV